MTKEEEEVNMVQSIPVKAEKKSNKRTQQIDRRKENKTIIDSGVTSHFMSEELPIPVEEASNKTVFLPDNSQLRTSTRTKLPFKQLSEAAREADNLPVLKRSLLSVNRIAEEGYTTIFHPGEEEVTIHKERTVTISTSKPPVLQGCKNYTEKLWTLSVSKDEEKEREEGQNVYILPSIPQSIRYLHAAAGFSVEATWIKAIKAGNFIIWPGLTNTTVKNTSQSLKKQ
jgi:hypothetical protein